MLIPYQDLTATYQGHPLPLRYQEHIQELDACFCENAKPLLKSIRRLEGYLLSVPTGLEIGSLLTLELPPLQGKFRLLSGSGAFRSEGVYTLDGSTR